MFTNLRIKTKRILNFLCGLLQLGLPPIKAESLDQSETQTGSTSLSQGDALSHSTLSFGAPQVVRQPKQQRRKPLSSKVKFAIEHCIHFICYFSPPAVV